MAPQAEHPAKGWAGTYGRKSLILPGVQTHSPGNQDRINKRAILTYGLKIKPGYGFFDVKTGYRDVRRPGFEKAVEALLNQEMEALVVPKLDRLSRRGMGQVGLLLDDLERVNGRIIFVGDGLDSSQPGARQIIAFLAEQARTESPNTGWRVAQFDEGARVGGKTGGGRPAKYLLTSFARCASCRRSAVATRWGRPQSGVALPIVALVRYSPIPALLGAGLASTRPTRKLCGSSLPGSRPWSQIIRSLRRLLSAGGSSPFLTRRATGQCWMPSWMAFAPGSPTWTRHATAEASSRPLRTSRAGSSCERTSSNGATRCRQRSMNSVRHLSSISGSCSTSFAAERAGMGSRYIRSAHSLASPSTKS